jgi:hypothetical protein
MPEISPIAFTARWTRENRCLKEKNGFLSGQGFRVFSSLFLNIPQRIVTLLNAICKEQILSQGAYSENEKKRIQASWHRKWLSAEITEENKVFREHFTALPMQLTTPDRARISGTFFKNNKSLSLDIPTIVCFQGRATLYKSQSFDPILKKAKKAPVPFNLVMFDYRSGKESQDEPKNAHSVVLDSETVYQCLKDELHIAEKNIRALAVSLGGAISAQMLALHPQAGPYVNIDSFKSIGAVVDNGRAAHSLIDYLHAPQILKHPKILFLFKKIMIEMIERFNWEFDSLKALQKIKSRKLIVYDPEDQVIPHKASLFFALQSKKWIRPEQTLSLKLKPHKCTPINWLHHGGPYSLYQDEQGTSASKRIFNFLIS